MSSQGVSEREFLEAKIAALEKLLDTKTAATEKALELQAREYERRLDKLNHDHENTKQIQMTYLPREMFDATVTAWQSWRDGVNKQLTTIQTRSITWTAAIGVFFMVVTILLNYWSKE